MRASRLFGVCVIVGTLGGVGAAERPSQLVRPLPHRASAQTPATPEPDALADVKEAESANEGMCASRSSGGPDPFGYTFIDSTEPGGPTFEWVELSGLGTQVLLEWNDQAGPFPVGFPFTFYGQVATQFFVQTDGAITFEDLSLTSQNSCPLPDLERPNELLAIMWDDLVAGYTHDPVWYMSFPAGACPYNGYGGACLVVEYENFHHAGGRPAGTFELILLDDNSLVMQFLDVGDRSGSESTTGIQSAGGTFGLTYACNLSYSLTGDLAIRFERTPPSQQVVLAADRAHTDICPRTAATYTFTVLNNTGAATGFDILYSGFSWSVSGEATLDPLGDGEGATFEMIHRPPEAALAGEADSVTVTVQSQSGPGSATVDVTSSVALYVVTSGPNAPDPRMDHTMTRWRTTMAYLYATAGYSGAYPLQEPGGAVSAIPGLPSVASVTPEATVNRFNLSGWTRRSSDQNPIPFPGDMAQGRNVSGEALLVAFPDASGLSDLLLHVYNLQGNQWDRAPLPAGFPPNGIWGHDIACDGDTNTCYITGGASSPGGGDLTTVYAYDAAANTVTLLPPFSSQRAHHASFLLDGLLCVAGGIDATDTPLSSTQCYDLAASSWRPENVDLGALPGTLWGMADAVMEIDGVLRPVMAGGIFDGGPPGTHFLWYDGVMWQHDEPFELGVYRTEADAINEKLYLVGGSTGGLAPTNALQKLRWCPTEAPANDDCSSALALEFGSWADVTNDLAGDSGPPLPSCAEYQGGDVWIRVTVPDTAFVPCFEPSAIPGSDVTDIGISYYAECPHTTEIECGGTNIGLGQLFPQQPGTYWLRVWEVGNDAFGSFAVGAYDCWIPVELMSFTVE